MYIRNAASVRRSDAGFILILAIVALVILTTMGLAAVSAAEMDMRIARNLRIHRQVSYAAIAGVEHARGILIDEVDTLAAAFNRTNGFAPSYCLSQYIGAGASAVDTPMILDTPLGSSSPFGTYTVDLCRVMCIAPGHGTDLASASTGKTSYSGAVMDAVSVGSRGNDQASSSTGGTLFGTVAMTCDGRN